MLIQVSQLTVLLIIRNSLLLFDLLLHILTNLSHRNARRFHLLVHLLHHLLTRLIRHHRNVQPNDLSINRWCHAKLCGNKRFLDILHHTRIPWLNLNRACVGRGNGRQGLQALLRAVCFNTNIFHHRRIGAAGANALEFLRKVIERFLKLGFCGF